MFYRQFLQPLVDLETKIPKATLVGVLHACSLIHRLQNSGFKHGRWSFACSLQQQRCEVRLFALQLQSWQSALHAPNLVPRGWRGLGCVAADVQILSKRLQEIERDFFAPPSAEICAQIFAVSDVEFCVHRHPNIYVLVACSA